MAGRWRGSQPWSVFAHPVLQAVLTREESDYDLRRVMDEGRIVLVKLAKGKLGDAAAALLGALLVCWLGLSGLSRGDAPGEERRDSLVYLDELENSTMLRLTSMLSKLRKYRVPLVLGHQYVTQLAKRVRDAILGNVGTPVVFRVGAADAEILEEDFPRRSGHVTSSASPNDLSPGAQSVPGGGASKCTTQERGGVKVAELAGRCKSGSGTSCPTATGLCAD